MFALVSAYRNINGVTDLVKLLLLLKKMEHDWLYFRGNSLKCIRKRERVRGKKIQTKIRGKSRQNSKRKITRGKRLRKTMIGYRRERRKNRK